MKLAANIIKWNLIVFKFSLTNSKKLQNFLRLQICAYFLSSFSGCWVVSNFFSPNKSYQIYPGAMQSPVVNFTNISWAAFVPKSFCQKITNPNCKHLKVVQRTLAWLSISPIFYKQLFHTKVLCEPFMFLQFGFVFFGERI